MKSYNHLMEKYLTDGNYYEAVLDTCKNKTGKRKKRKQSRYLKGHREQLKPEIMELAEHYVNGKHTPITIYDGISRKKRTIIVPSLKEQVVHHMVVNTLKPIFMKGMYEHSYGSVPGRGAVKGKKRYKKTRSGQEIIEKWIRKGGKEMKYCLKMDIKKYYDSVPHDIIKMKLARIIHDEKFLNVLYAIIDASPNGKGLPIGFYTSQWFANWYLTELDHYIKQDLHAQRYIRYMDDMVVFGSNKRKLHRMRVDIEKYLNEKLGLEMKENWQVFLFDYVDDDGNHRGRDLDFMGLRFFRNKTILRKTLMLKMCRKAKRVARKAFKTVYDCRQMLSYNGWLKNTKTYGMYKLRIKPFISFKNLKQFIGAYQRRLNLCQLGERLKMAQVQNLPQLKLNPVESGTM